MQLRLIYEGPLSPRQKDPETNQYDKLADHVQEIRKVFHEQLKEFWKTNSFLSTCEMDPDWIAQERRITATIGIWDDGPQRTIPLWLAMAEKYREHGYRFVPLVREQWRLDCEIDVLLLRRDHGHGVIKDGDLDNRMKTLIDGLRKPIRPEELRGNEIPSQEEDPFFVLLEEDSLITSLHVNADQLLVPQGSDKIRNSKEVYAVINVSIRPRDPTIFTFSFF